MPQRESYDRFMYNQYKERVRKNPSLEERIKVLEEKVKDLEVKLLRNPTL